ncbi:MAG: hypothetical protein GXY80_02965 [Syntrophorhabdus aromaticivorans]|uniref:Uncharacterized protein n=1 Tax=Syntrophorhabdus aromaticivorans TaxID=328301 RepID=A0A971M310_9BACT|nr:hypothetical protein [Syntrophorhabdus aromaticivorans]
MARRGGFKSDKRRKELLRLQKQAEKRQRRFAGKTGDEPIDSEPVPENMDNVGEGAAPGPENAEEKAEE